MDGSAMLMIGTGSVPKSGDTPFEVSYSGDSLRACRAARMTRDMMRLRGCAPAFGLGWLSRLAQFVSSRVDRRHLERLRIAEVLETTAFVVLANELAGLGAGGLIISAKGTHMQARDLDLLGVLGYGHLGRIPAVVGPGTAQCGPMDDADRALCVRAFKAGVLRPTGNQYEFTPAGKELISAWRRARTLAARSACERFVVADKAAQFTIPTHTGGRS